MVLKKIVSGRLVLCMAYFLLASCSVTQKQASQRDLIVPAQIPKQELSVVTESPKSDERKSEVFDSKEEVSEEEGKVQAETKKKPSEETMKPRPTGTSSADLLFTLLNKARKAMSMQQWLRAQRALEQALRIDPDSSDTYVLYGDVYKGMGIKEKAKEMYKRAIFLSGNDEKLRAKLLSEDAADELNIE